MTSQQEKENIMGFLDGIKECLESQAKVNETVQKAIGNIDERIEVLEDAIRLCYEALKIVEEGLHNEEQIHIRNARRRDN